MHRCTYAPCIYKVPDPRIVKPNTTHRGAARRLEGRRGALVVRIHQRLAAQHIALAVAPQHARFLLRAGKARGHIPSITPRVAGRREYLLDIVDELAVLQPHVVLHLFHLGAVQLLLQIHYTLAVGLGLHDASLPALFEDLCFLCLVLNNRGQWRRHAERHTVDTRTQMLS